MLELDVLTENGCYRFKEVWFLFLVTDHTRGKNRSLVDKSVSTDNASSKIDGMLVGISIR